MQSAFSLAEKPLLEIVTQVRNGLPAAMFEHVASTLGLSVSTSAAKLGIARHAVTRKRGNRGNRAPLSSENSEKLLRVARVRNLGRTLFTTDEAVSEWMSKPDASLGNMAPWELLDTDLGAREVENLLRALSYGHFVCMRVFRIGAALFTRLPFGGGSGLNQLVGKPELDQRLPRHAESARFTVE